MSTTAISTANDNYGFSPSLESNDDHLTLTHPSLESNNDHLTLTHPSLESNNVHHHEVSSVCAFSLR